MKNTPQGTLVFFPLLFFLFFTYPKKLWQPTNASCDRRRRGYLGMWVLGAWVGSQHTMGE